LDSGSRSPSLKKAALVSAKNECGSQTSDFTDLGLAKRFGLAEWFGFFWIQIQFIAKAAKGSVVACEDTALGRLKSMTNNTSYVCGIKEYGILSKLWKACEKPFSTFWKKL